MRTASLKTFPTDWWPVLGPWHVLQVVFESSWSTSSSEPRLMVSPQLWSHWFSSTSYWLQQPMSGTPRIPMPRAPSAHPTIYTSFTDFLCRTRVQYVQYLQYLQYVQYLLCRTICRTRVQYVATPTHTSIYSSTADPGFRKHYFSLFGKLRPLLATPSCHT